MKTYYETVAFLAKERYESYLAGGVDYLYTIDYTIAWIYNKTVEEISAEVQKAFKDTIKRKHK